MHQPAFSSPKATKLFKAIFQTGLLVGTLDLSSAFIHAWFTSGTTLGTLLQFVASGLFGKQAFSGGTPMMVLGMLFHYCIAYSFTAIFFWLYPRLPLLSRNRWVSGILYGIVVWLVMNLLVLPLTNIPKIPFHLFHAAVNMGILIVMIGIPISLLAHKHYTQVRVKG